MRIVVLCAALVLPVAAQDFENFHVELTGSAWLVNTSGTIQSGFVPVNLTSDLNIEGNKPQFFGRLVVKPARRHRLWLEGTPYHLTGLNQVSRSISFAGRTYTVQDQVSSEADIGYFAAGYQFDVVSRPRGHLGLGGGGGYVNATGTIRSQTFGFSGTESQSFAFPVAGAEGRVFLNRLLNINGEIKGMSLGSYGHYLQAGIHAGVSLGRHFSLEAGYLLADADVHRKDATRGFTPRFAGPIFSAQFRY